MQLSNLEQLKFNYCNRRLGAAMDGEFSHFTLGETLALYESEMNILRDLGPFDHASRRFMETSALLRNYHEFLHKQQRTDDSEMVYELNALGRKVQCQGKETALEFFSTLAELCGLTLITVSDRFKHYQLWPNEATDHVMLEVFFKEEDIRIERISPSMAKMIQTIAAVNRL